MITHDRGMITHFSNAEIIQTLIKIKSLVLPQVISYNMAT